jgi:hypothetical protein
MTEGRVWTQRVGGFTAVPALIRQLGADPIRILTDVGLAPDALDRPEQRIPYASMGALFQEAATRTGCSHFGLLCGRAWHLSDLGLVGEVVKNSPTVSRALQTLTVYQHLNSEGGLPFFLQRDGVADIGYAIYHPGVGGASQIYDTLMAGYCNFLHELCGANWTLSVVLFPHTNSVRYGFPLIGWIGRSRARILRSFGSRIARLVPRGTSISSSGSIGRCAFCCSTARVQATKWHKCWPCIAGR